MVRTYEKMRTLKAYAERTLTIHLQAPHWTSRSRSRVGDPSWGVRAGIHTWEYFPQGAGFPDMTLAHKDELQKRYLETKVYSLDMLVFWWPHVQASPKDWLLRELRWGRGAVSAEVQPFIPMERHWSWAFFLGKGSQSNEAESTGLK